MTSQVLYRSAKQGKRENTDPKIVTIFQRLANYERTPRVISGE